MKAWTGPQPSRPTPGQGLNPQGQGLDRASTLKAKAWTGHKPWMPGQGLNPQGQCLDRTPTVKAWTFEAKATSPEAKVFMHMARAEIKIRSTCNALMG